MKKLIAYLLTACALAAQVPNVNVQKSPSTNALTNSFIVGSGTSVTPNGTGIIIATNVSGNVSWNQITNTPNSAVGYGIVNGATIDQLGASPQTGTGAIVFSNNATLNSATMVTPNLGTPSYVSLNNGSNLPTTALTGKITNSQLTNNSITVTAGTGLSGGGNVQLGGTITLTNNYNGTVTQVGGTGNVNGITLTGNVTTTGNLTLGGTLGNITNSQLTNNSINVIAGNGLSGGGNTQLGSSVTLSNAGVTNISTGTGISANASTGSITLSNTGVTSIVAGTNVTINSATGSVQINSSNPGGTVTSVSTNNQNGVITSVATATSTPNITIGLGNITPTSVTSVMNGSLGLTTPNAVYTNNLRTTTLTGYLYGNSTNNVTASTSIPTTALSGTITNSQLTNNSINIVTGTGLSGGSNAQLGSTVTLTNTGVTNIVAGSNITVNANNGSVQISSSNPGGTVTSVGLAAPSGLTVTNTPVTSSGTLTLSTTLNGYVSGNGNNGLTASTTILGSAITGNIAGNAANVTGVVAVINGGTGVTTSTGSGSNVLSNSPTLVTPNLGQPTYADLTNATRLPLSSGVTGILPVANGGTGTATPATVAGTGISVSGSFPNQTITNAGVTNLVAGSGVTLNTNNGSVTINATGTGGTVTSVSGTGTVQGITLTGNVTSSGSLTLGGSLSAINLASQVTGTLNVASGGTGTNGLTGYVYGNGTSAMTASTTIPTSALTSNSITITAGTGLSGGGTVALGGTTTLSNAGVTSVIAGTGVTVNSSTGSVTINATGTGGTVTNLSVTGNSGVLAGVATPTTTPAISIGLGNITPLSVTTNAGSFTTLNSSGTTSLITSTGNAYIGTTSAPALNTGANFYAYQNGSWTEFGGSASTDAIRLRGSGAALIDFISSTQDPNVSPYVGGRIFYSFPSNYMSFYSNGANTETMRLNSAGNLLLYSTASSSSTSTGALVVGNGSSGGLGVGGNINAGGTINQWSGFSSSMSSYANFNANNNSNASSFIGGVLVYGGSGYYYGMDLGYNSSTFRYRTRLFANNTSDVAFSFCGLNPSSQSALTDAMIIRGDTGNVGIGTTSPSYKMSFGANTSLQQTDIYLQPYNVGGANNEQRITNGQTASTYSSVALGFNDLSVGDGSYIAFRTAPRTNSTIQSSGDWSYERMRIDSAGNVGIGVTPAAWNAGGFTALELTNGTALWSTTSSSATPSTWLSNNLYYTGSFYYKNNAAAGGYVQSDGYHHWYTAPTGTAGAGATLTEQMYLTSGGLKVVNTTSSSSTTSGALQVVGGVGIGGNVNVGGTVYGLVNYGSTGAGNIQFFANPSAGAAYFAANRASSSTGEVGYGYYTGGSISWLNLINIGDTSLAWYNPSSGTAMKLTTTGILQLFNNGVTYYATPGTFYNQDASTNTIVLANGGTVNFSNFSGFVFVNNNSTAGQTIFCCTGGYVTNFGTGGSSYGAMAGNSSINGYTFTNTTGSSGTFGIYVIRLRQGE